MVPDKKNDIPDASCNLSHGIIRNNIICPLHDYKGIGTTMEHPRDAEKRNDNKCIKLGGGTIYSAKRWKEYPLYPDDLKAVANERKTNVFVLTDIGKNRLPPYI